MDKPDASPGLVADAVGSRDCYPDVLGAVFITAGDRPGEGIDTDQDDLLAAFGFRCPDGLDQDADRLRIQEIDGKGNDGKGQSAGNVGVGDAIGGDTVS